MIGAQQLLGAVSFAPLLIFGANSTIQSSICYQVAQPVITAPASGASVPAGSLFVAGTGTASSTVSVKIDGQAMATVTATGGGNFGATVTVAPGAHTLSATSSNQCSTATSSSVAITAQGSINPTPIPTPTPTPTPSPTPVPSTRTPTYTTTTSTASQSSDGGTLTQEPLTLSIDASLDGSTVKYSTVYVAGKLSRVGTVKVVKDGTTIAESTAASTTFGFSVPLTEGKNTLTIIATTEDGTTVSREITVTRSATSEDSTNENFGSLDRSTTNNSNSSTPKSWYDGLFSGVGLYILLGIIGVIVVLAVIGGVFTALYRRKKGGN